MEFYLQFGHGMIGISKTLLEEWGTGSGVIISPRDLKPKQVSRVALDAHAAGAEPLFDPQCYVHDSDHKRLLAHPFYQAYFNAHSGSLFDPQTISEILNHLAKSNQDSEIHRHILPGRLADPVDNDWFEFQRRIINSAEKQFNGEPLIATVALSNKSVESEEQFEAVIEAAKSWNVEGFYVVCEGQGGYLTDNPVCLGNLLVFVSGLKLLDRQVLVGYTNQQILSVVAAGADILCSGNFLNTRRFSLEKFYEPDEESKSRRSTWFYCPQAYSEFKIPFLDLAKRRGVLDQMRPNENLPQQFCSALFGEAQPSAVNWKEGSAFCHYLANLRSQARAIRRGSYAETQTQYLQSVENADQLLDLLKRQGVLAGDRAFNTDVSTAVRSALTQLQSARGIQLENSWR